MTVPIRVTVDGEPVVREVTLDQVREYLRAKGWEMRAEREKFQLWMRPGDTEPESPVVWVEDWPDPGLRAHGARGTICSFARHERRKPAAVLREIEAHGAAEENAAGAPVEL